MTTPFNHPQRGADARRALAAVAFAALAIHPASALHYKPYGEAPPLQVELDCGNPSLASGSPLFRTAPAGFAEYSFRGLCKGVNQQTYVSYWVSGTWTPTETDPRKANASESYNIQLNKDVWPSRDPGTRGEGSVVFIFGAHCNIDPWLNPGTANCTPVGDNVPDDVRRAWPALAAARFPRSRNGIPDQQRGRLLAEYQRINPVRVAATPRVGNAKLDAKVIEASPYGTATKTPGMPRPAGFVAEATPHPGRQTMAAPDARAQAKIAPPEIVLPAPGSQMGHGQLRVQVRAPVGSDNAVAEVEFSWLEPRQRTPSATPPAAAPATVVWKVPMAQLARGAIVPPADSPTRTGPWLVKVRSGAGAWSTGVSFNFSAPQFSRTATTTEQGGSVFTKSALNPQPLPPKSGGNPATDAKTQVPTGAARNWNQAPAILGR